MKLPSSQLDLFQVTPTRKFRRGEFKQFAFVGPVRKGCANIPAADPTSPVSRAQGLYVPVTRKVSPINGTETGPANG